MYRSTFSGGAAETAQGAGRAVAPPVPPGSVAESLWTVELMTSTDAGATGRHYFVVRAPTAAAALVGAVFLALGPSACAHRRQARLVSCSPCVERWLSDDERLRYGLGRSAVVSTGVRPGRRDLPGLPATGAGRAHCRA